jgi:hypothetical protein
MNKFFISLCFFVLLSLTVRAQILTPTTWSWQSSKNSVKIGEELDVIFKATIPAGGGFIAYLTLRMSSWREPGV